MRYVVWELVLTNWGCNAWFWEGIPISYVRCFVYILENAFYIWSQIKTAFSVQISQTQAQTDPCRVQLFVESLKRLFSVTENCSLCVAKLLESEPAVAHKDISYAPLEDWQPKLLQRQG